MRKNSYLRCTIRGDGKDGKVEFYGSGKELLMMIALILQKVADEVNIDIEKFCEYTSKITIEASKIMAKKDEENEENEDH